MRKLSTTLLLIGISFMTMEANNCSTDRKISVYFKKWDDRQKSVFSLSIEATIEENNTEVQFFEKSNEPAIFRIKDGNGNIVFQDVTVPDKLETCKIDLDSFKVDSYGLFYVRESITFVGGSRIEQIMIINQYIKETS